MKKIFALVFSVVAVILEALPWGVALYFGNPEGEPFRSTFSYFSLTPYGYAVFSPLFTAILSVLLLASCIFLFFSKKEKLATTAHLLSVAAVILSLCHLFYGIRYFTWIGLCITLCLTVCVLCLWKKEK